MTPMLSQSPSSSRLDPQPLLLSPDLARSDVARLLAPYGFHDWEKADANLQLMAGDPRSRKLLAVILPDLLQTVSTTPDPDQALNEWERYLNAGKARAQVFSFLAQAPPVLQLVCILFGNSPAMAETLIRDPMLVYWIEEERILKSRPANKQLQATLQQSLDLVKTYEHKLGALRRFHRREMLRIGARDLFRVSSVRETFESLSQLAELVIHAAYQLVNERLQRRYGVPYHPGPRNTTVETGFVVLGMGKLGGRELNYSSDVDLIYLYASSHGHVKTVKGRTSVSGESFFQMLARELTHVLSASTPEGRLFRVDMRLRPEGAVGPLAWSIHEAVKYYQTRGRAWERLALFKARSIAGQRALGQAFLRKIRPFIIGQEERTNQTIGDAVRTLRVQIHQNVKRKGENDRNVKLSPGGIRDVEFLVQTLQLTHVVGHPRLFEPNTIKSLQRLRDAGLLSASDCSTLTDAYVFLRDVEHKLQMVHELQTHTLPVQPPELAKCAIRMGWPSAPEFLARYRSVMTQVQRIHQRVLPSLF